MCSSSDSTTDSNDAVDVEDLHTAACASGSTTYQDPTTGFTVFTEVAHLKRGVCCGNQCRHCPYGWQNVRHNNDDNKRLPKVTSGDKEGAAALLQEIQKQAALAVQQTKLAASTATTSANHSSSIQQQQPHRTGGRHGGTLTRKNVPYTRTGDQGRSQLLTGERRSKADAAFEAMGTVDELCSTVGVCHAQLMVEIEQEQQDALDNDDNDNNINLHQLNEWLLDVMSRLFDIGSHVAKPPNETGKFRSDGVGGGLDAQHVTELEEWIDLLTEALPELSSFILPTGTVTAAQLHVARTVCRRAERTLVPLVQDGLCDPNAMAYVNRLSDFLFTAARFVNYNSNGGAGANEILYRRPHRAAKQRSRVIAKDNTSTSAAAATTATNDTP